MQEQTEGKGKLIDIGTFGRGRNRDEYYKCADCETRYIVIRGYASCNGSRISKCPYCREAGKLP